MERNIIFATNNKDKLTEILPLLETTGRTMTGAKGDILSLADLKVNLDVEEFENSLFENAAKKAVETYDYLLKKRLIKATDIVIAEDSGLFGNKTGYPGVITKRELKRLGLEKMLNHMKTLEKAYNDNKDEMYENDYSRARYESVLAYYSNDKRFFSVAKEEGVIMDEPQGEFNYPIDKYFRSNTRGPLGLIEPEEFSETSFRRKPYDVIHNQTYLFLSETHDEINVNKKTRELFTTRFTHLEKQPAYQFEHSPYVVIRLDGKGFSKFTKINYDGKFNERFKIAMENSMLAVAKEFNAIMCYHQSDEVTLVFKRGQNTTTDISYGARKSKLESVITSAFTYNFMLERLANESLEDVINNKSLFDARAIGVYSYEDVLENLMWRAVDGHINSINVKGQSHFTRSELHAKNVSTVRSMLKDAGHPWEDLSDDFKFGELYVKEPVTFKSDYDGTLVTRNKLVKQNASKLVIRASL